MTLHPSSPHDLIDGKALLDLLFEPLINKKLQVSLVKYKMCHC